MARLFLPVIAGLLLTVVLPAAGFAQSAGIRTYANPLDIDYKYNFEQLNEGVSYRSGADPVVVNHKGEYFLFVTVSGGYWHSKDLIHWRFVTPTRWPFEDNVAPAAISERDTLFLMQSAMLPRPILYSTDPASGPARSLAALGMTTHHVATLLTEAWVVEEPGPACRRPPGSGLRGRRRNCPPRRP